MFYFLLKRYHKKYRYWELTRYKQLKCILLELKIYLPEYKDACYLYLNVYQNIDL